MSILGDAAPQMLEALKTVLPQLELLHRQIEPYTFLDGAPAQFKNQADEIFQAIATVSLAIRAAEPEPTRKLSGCECVDCRLKTGKLFRVPAAGDMR